MAGEVYWVGGDNNVYYKTSSGVQNVGAPIKTYNGGFDAARLSGTGTQIADPNPQPGPSTNTAASSQAADPYAAWGGAAKYNALISGFGAQKNNIISNSNDAASNAGIGLRTNILDLVDSLRSGQRSIDSKAINNELAKQQGTAGVLGMVGRGIKSGGVTLANKNASNSSATDALARAYGDIGRREQSKVGNQYELGNRDVLAAQQNLEDQRASGSRKIAASKEQIISSIVSDARNSLAALDAQIAGANLPQRIQIEQEKQKVRDQVVGQLGQYDTMLANETGAIKPTSLEDRRAQAAQLATAGTAPESAFSYTDAVPAQFQNTGPFAANLPIFTYRSKDNLAAA